MGSGLEEQQLVLVAQSTALRFEGSGICRVMPELT